MGRSSSFKIELPPVIALYNGSLAACLGQLCLRPNSRSHPTVGCPSIPPASTTPHAWSLAVTANPAYVEGEGMRGADTARYDMVAAPEPAYARLLRRTPTVSYGVGLHCVLPEPYWRIR